MNHPDSTIFSALKRLYQHFSKRRRIQLALVFSLMLVGAFAELATISAVLPFLALLADPMKASDYAALQSLFSMVGWQTDESILLPVTMLFVTIAIIAGAIRIVLLWASQKFVFRVGHDLGVKVYRRTLYQPYSYHISRNTSEIIAGIDKVNGVLFQVLLQVMQVVVAAVISVFIIAALIVIDPTIAVIAAIGFGALYLLVSYATRHLLKTNSILIAKAMTKRVKTVQEGLGGIRDVLLGHVQPVYFGKFRTIDLAFRDAQMVNVFIGASPRFAIEAGGMVVIALLALLLATGEGGILAALPVLGALALGAQRLLPQFQLIYLGWSNISGNRQTLFDVLELLEQPMPELPLARDGVLELPFKRDIVLKNMTFRYGPEQPAVLDGINLTIVKGGRIGFIGKTGSGKSTILDLVMGLLEPTEGEIQIDGVSLNAETRQSWQARIAHVPQAIYLSDASIAENIAFGVDESDIDMKQVRKAACKAEIAEFIESLSEGYMTSVGERGVRLSGGQRQRIGIARALYKKADVLIFDEATSALDDATEAAVITAINSLGRDLTILMIAHRLSTVSVCDQVVKLSDGNIEAIGTYDEIVQSKLSLKVTY